MSTRTKHIKQRLSLRIVLFFCLVLNNLVNAQEFKADKNLALVPYPTLKKNQVYGWGGGVSLIALYRFKKKDTVTPPQMTVFQPVYFQNKSYYLAFYNKTHLKQDKYRNILLLYKTRMNFQFYADNILPNVIDTSGYIPYTSEVVALLERFEYKVIGDLYVGLQFNISNKAFSMPNEQLQEFLESRYDLSQREIGLGGSVRYDSRDNILDPSKGINFYADIFFYGQKIGSEVKYSSFSSEFSYFYKFKSARLIIGAKATADLNFGEVPFLDQQIMGYGGEFKSDLRGYNKGQYRGNYLMALQVEPRWNFYKKWSLNMFAGVGTAFSEKGEMPFLPASGLGVRYMAIPRFKFNVGIDAAVGKDDYGVYFSIGQAF